MRIETLPNGEENFISSCPRCGALYKFAYTGNAASTIDAMKQSLRDHVLREHPEEIEAFDDGFAEALGEEVGHQLRQRGKFN